MSFIVNFLKECTTACNMWNIFPPDFFLIHAYNKLVKSTNIYESPMLSIIQELIKKIPKVWVW